MPRADAARRVPRVRVLAALGEEQHRFPRPPSRRCFAPGNAACRPSSAATHPCSSGTPCRPAEYACRASPEIHDGLGIRGRPLLRRARIRPRPEFVQHRRRARISTDPEHPRQHPLGIPIQDRMPLAPRERQNRPGRRAPDPRQRRHLLEFPRKRPRHAARRSPGARMEIPRPRVIPEPGPKMQHLVDRPRRERLARSETAP